jgi:hypothetical protein
MNAEGCPWTARIYRQRLEPELKIEKRAIDDDLIFVFNSLRAYSDTTPMTSIACPAHSKCIAIQEVMGIDVDTCYTNTGFLPVLARV